MPHDDHARRSAGPTVRPPRPEPRELVELKQIRAAQPELASAVDMQIALTDLQRRMQARVPLPWLEANAEWTKRQHAAGRPLLRFAEIPLDWTVFRLIFRQTADVLRRFDALEAADYAPIQALARESQALEPLVVRWYHSTAAPQPEPLAESVSVRHAPSSPVRTVVPEMLDQVILLAMRPFLVRCVEVVLQRSDLSGWRYPYCPVCGGEPDFAVISQAGDRLLICGRCTAHWRFASFTCPYCQNDDRALITSFASRDGKYRIYACDVCRRYIKAYDARRSSRPLMLGVDTVATLPLDAAAVQKGYRG